MQAQQVPHYHHYFLNGMVFNPAATGYYQTTNAFFMRNQRNLGFEGGNIVNALTVDGSLFQNKLGAGIILYSDIFGPSSGTGGLVSLSYKVNFSETSFLRFGMSGGVEDHRINFDQAIVKDPDDKELNNGNPGRKIVANANAGILLQLKKFQFGFSVPQLLGINSDFKALINDGTSTGGSYTFERHYVGSLRYDFEFSDKLGLKVSPLALVKFLPGAPIMYDAGLLIDFRDFVWLNATYKANYSVTASVGFKIKKSICIGYAYDVVINNGKSYAGINQEILLGYRFPVEVKGKNNDKELEEAQKEIERLNQEVVAKRVEIDTINNQKNREKAIAENKYNEMEKSLNKDISDRNDSINKLNELLRKKVDPVKTDPVKTDPVKTDPVKTDPPKKFDDSQIKKSDNDYFIEMDQSDSPQGLYVVFGAFSKDDLAQAQLNKYKSEFPEARMIYNKRNGYKYIVFKYSNQKQPVFETRDKAHQKGLTKAWILNYVR